MSNTRILSPLVAATADHRNYTLLRELKARCERMGFPLDLASDQPISLMAMDAAFDGKDVAERLRIKTALKSLRLI